LALVISVLVHAQGTRWSSSRSHVRANRLPGSETISGTSADASQYLTASQPVGPVLREGLRNACRQLKGRAVEDRCGRARAGPEEAIANQPVADGIVAPRLGRHQPGDRHAAVKDLNLTAPPDMAKVTREVGLESGD